MALKHMWPLTPREIVCSMLWLLSANGSHAVRSARPALRRPAWQAGAATEWLCFDQRGRAGAGGPGGAPPPGQADCRCVRDGVRPVCQGLSYALRMIAGPARTVCCPTQTDRNHPISPRHALPQAAWRARRTWLSEQCWGTAGGDVRLQGAAAHKDAGLPLGPATGFRRPFRCQRTQCVPLHNTRTCALVRQRLPQAGGW